MGSFVTNHPVSLSPFWCHDSLYSTESFLPHDPSWVISSKFSKGILDNDENGKLPSLVIVCNLFEEQSSSFVISCIQIPDMAYILAILAIITIFYAWFGVVIFANSEQGAAGFPNLLEGVW